MTADFYEQVDTKWTLVLALNSIVYIILASGTFCTILGSFFAPFLLCSFCQVCCGTCLHFATIVVTGVFRFVSQGDACSKSQLLIADDTSFKDVGSTIQNLFISQCVLYSFYNCIAIAHFTSTMQLAGFSLMERFKR